MLRIDSVARLYLVRLRSRLAQELLTVVGIAIGVALVFSALIANASLTGSVEQLTSGIVGKTRYQLAARGGTSMDARMLRRVERLPGVRAAAPILEARVVVSGPKGRRSLLLVGANPAFADLGGPLVRRFTSAEIARQQAVALPAPVASAIGVGSFGESVEVITADGAKRAVLGGRLHEDDIGDLVSSPVILAPLAYAQDLAGLRGRITRVFVQPVLGADARVRRELVALAGDRYTVRAASGDVDVFEQAAMPTNQSTAMFATFAALIGFLFALSAVLLTVPQRRRFIEDVRMAGYRPSAIVQLVLFDALVVGAVGVLAGLALGDVLSRNLFGSVPGYLAFAFPIGGQRVVDWPSIAIASAAGVVAAAVAVLVPIRGVFSTAQGAGANQAPDRLGRRLLAGTFAIAVAGAVLVADTDSAVAWWTAMAALTVALVCFLPSLLTLASGGLERAGRGLRSPVPFLALSELGSREARPRTFALAATGAVAVFASVAIGGARGDLQRGLDASASDIDANAAVWATFPGAPNAFATTPFHVPPATLRQLERIPGVDRVREYRGAFLDVGDRRVWILAPPRDAPSPFPASQLAEGDLTLANRRIRTGGWVTVSEAVAHEQHVGIGDTLTLPTPVPTRMRVAALSTNLGWPPGAIVMNASEFARSWDADASSALHLALDPNADADAVKVEASRILAPQALTVETLGERERRHYDASREGLQRLSQIAILVLVAAVLAMATAMVGALWQRRPMLAGIKVDGIRQGSLWRSLLLESAVLLGTGCIAGAMFGLAGQVMLSHALEVVTGFPVFYSAGTLIAAGSLALVVLVALAVLALPGWLVVRVPASPSATE